MHCLVAEAKRTIATHIVWQPAPVGGQDCPIGDDVTDNSIILEDHMNIKKAQRFLRNIKLIQEFHFFSPGPKMTINQVHNSSWYGSVLYNIYGTEAVKLESCCIRGIKNMMDLPFGTRNGLIEPLSERQHLRKTFTRRFIDMIERKISRRSKF